jgi:hypothetical protein
MVSPCKSATHHSITLNGDQAREPESSIRGRVLDILRLATGPSALEHSVEAVAVLRCHEAGAALAVEPRLAAAEIHDRLMAIVHCDGVWQMLDHQLVGEHALQSLCGPAWLLRVGIARVPLHTRMLLQLSIERLPWNC